MHNMTSHEEVGSHAVLVFSLTTNLIGYKRRCHAKILWSAFMAQSCIDTRKARKRKNLRCLWFGNQISLTRCVMAGPCCNYWAMPLKIIRKNKFESSRKSRIYSQLLWLSHRCYTTTLPATLCLAKGNHAILGINNLTWTLAVWDFSTNVSSNLIIKFSFMFKLFCIHPLSY